MSSVQLPQPARDKSECSGVRFVWRSSERSFRTFRKFKIPSFLTFHNAILIRNRLYCVHIHQPCLVQGLRDLWYAPARNTFWNSTPISSPQTYIRH